VSAPTHLSPGAIFAKDFRIVRPLRAGGMGAVYIAEQISTGKQRALKLMAAELVDKPEVRERFVREAKVAANIESDHVVETVTAGVDDATGAPYLVMELLRGEELADAVERCGPMPLGDVAEILSQVGHALEQAHAQGVVHRDLKPENIFLAASKRREVPFTAKILDFGIAKLVADGLQKTGTQPLGSPLFMSPEQTDRKGKIGPPTDVWALGLIAFYVLTGKSYWTEAEDGSLAGLLREICVDPIVFASARAKEKGIDGKLPVGFDAWFARCVDRDVDARFRDAGEAVRAFAELVQGAPMERKFVLKTSTIDPSSAVVATAALGSARTALLDSTGVAPLTRIGDGTGAAAAVVREPTGSIDFAPQKRGFGLYAVVGIAAVALGGGGIYLATRAPPSSPSAAGYASGAPQAQPLSSATADSGSRPATSAAGALPTPVAPTDAKCPAGMVYHPTGKTFIGSKTLPDYSGANVDGTRKVELSSFCLDVTEVTVRAYEACVQDATCERTPDDVNFKGLTADARKRKLYVGFCNARKPDRVDHPINCVSFDLAAAYCKSKNARLPTETEWEYAARGPVQHDYPWGDEAPDEKRLNAAGTEYQKWEQATGGGGKTMFEGDDGWSGTAPVGQYPAGKSGFGVYDLAGNVWEWTADQYGAHAAGEFKDPQGPATGTERVIRGGAFNGWDPAWANPAWRYRYAPGTYSHAVGFRCAADAIGEPRLK